MARPTRAHSLALALAFASCPAAARAQQPAPAPAAALPTPSLRAGRAAGMHVDGRLDEAAWATAEVGSGFVQQRPRSGQPATDPTEVRVLVDGEAIYVGARMLDAHPDSIAAQLARRDASGIYSDWFQVVIDSYHDRRTGYRFGVNPMGVQKDVFHSNDSNEDADWDAVWEAAATRDSLGWTAEMRIPLSQLRYGKVAAGTEPVWGINFLRDVARRDERSYWSQIPNNYAGFVSREGELRGLAGLGTPRRLELQPYTSARLAREPGTHADPFFRQNALHGSVGADVKYGLPAGLTLTGTINPDFGQVEVDPAVVNLSAFETFFPEKRPFFVEGSDIFSFGNIQAFNNFGAPTFFYTRRIGRSPHHDLANSFQFVDQPQQSTILGAAKVSGKTPGGLSVGVLDAVTAREDARFVGDDGLTHGAPVEPMTNYFVGRLRHDYHAGNTVIGGLVTAANRDMAGGEFDADVRRNAYVGGADFEHAWANRLWTLTGFLSGSRVSGTPGALLLTQRSSARYFQRPDADYLRVDSSRTSLLGRDGALAIQRSGSYDLSVAYQETSPGFETNDLGFQGNADRRSVSTFIGRRVNTPNRVFRDHTYYAFTNHQWNFGGDYLFDGYAVAAQGTFKNLWFVGGDVRYYGRTLNDRLTRGGPLAANPRQVTTSLNWSSDPRKRLSANGNLSVAEKGDAGHSREGSVSLLLRPSSSVQVSVGPGLTRDLNRGQFVRSVADEAASATFGRRYVFGDVDQTTLSMDTRLDWTFTPKLSLQLFAQPFVSSGKFSNYKEFLRPRDYDFAVYGRDRGTIARTVDAEGNASYTVDPDGAGPAESFAFGEQSFTVRSLRGNAVLRWEYHPGSALFVVWQQQRDGFDPDGSFDGHDVRHVFTEPAHNVFLIKATYWLSR
jgi:hypothetical protein